MLKIAVFSIAVILMVSAEPPPSQGGYIQGPGPQGGFSGYNRAPQHQQQHRPQQQYRIKPAGASKIFGWLGSKFPRIPSFLPRFPGFPKYKQPNQLPNYQAVILPQPQAQLYGQKPQQVPEKVQIFGPTFAGTHNGQNYYSTPIAQQSVITYQPIQQQQQQQFRPIEQNVEVLPSHMISYEKEIVSGNQQQNYYQPTPVSSPPLYATGGGRDQIPTVPQSNGPDYFNTAYTQDGQQQQQQYTVQSIDGDNYGASFGHIQQASQSSPQIYDASLDLRAVGGPVIDSSSQQQQEQSYMDGTSVAGGQDDASLSSIISSLTEQTGGQGQNYQIQPQQETAYSQQSISTAQPSPQQYYDHQPAQSQQQNVRVTSSYSRVGNTRGQEIVPGVKLMSQGTNDGNPVFEVVADANAPLYNGHPFDINKLISMIEPGAELESAPQLSEASSENRETYVEAPAQAGISIPQQQQQQQESSYSGISDLQYSASEPHPSIINLNGTRISAMPSSLLKPDDEGDADDDDDVDYSMLDESSSSSSSGEKNNFVANNSDSSSSLMELMQFFQKTEGKGFVVVERKGSNLTLTNSTDTDSLTVELDDDLTHDGPSLINITSETIPQFEVQHHNTNTNTNKHSLIDPTYPKKAGFSSLNSKSSTNSTTTSFVKLPNSTYLTPTAASRTTGIILPPTKTQTLPAVVFPTRKSKPYINIRQPPSQSVSLPSVTKKTTAKLAFKPNYSLPPPRPTQTTQNPNHNYNATPSTTSSDYPLLGILPGLPNTLPKINPILDSVAEIDSDDDSDSTVDDLLETEDDLAISESQQVKSIAITVTPPPQLTRNIANTTPVSLSTTSEDPTAIPIPIPTQKSVSYSKSSKSFPFPVYRKKTTTK